MFKPRFARLPSQWYKKVVSKNKKQEFLASWNSRKEYGRVRIVTQWYGQCCGSFNFDLDPEWDPAPHQSALTTGLQTLDCSWILTLMRILIRIRILLRLQCGYGSGFSLWCGSGYTFSACSMDPDSYKNMTDAEHGYSQLGGHLWFVCCREIEIRNHQLWTWRQCSRPQNSTCSRGGHCCAFTSFLFLRTPRQKGFLVEWWPAAVRGFTKRCLLSWLTNSALVYEPKRGEGELPMRTAIHRISNKQDLTPYITYTSGVGEPNLCGKSEFALLRSVPWSWMFPLKFDKSAVFFCMMNCINSGWNKLKDKSWEGIGPPTYAAQRTIQPS